MNIGQVAEASGVSRKMIRYYEQIGLIPEAHRTTSGYRAYTDTDIHTLRFIRRARDLGFSVEAIRELLALWQDRSRHSADVKALALGHVDLLQRRIQALTAMVQTLQSLADCCAGDQRPECPILADLASGDAPVALRHDEGRESAGSFRGRRPRR